jgi:putative ABC transport system permease protein
LITIYTWAILWHDRQRFMPAILAVAFSAVLIAVQCGLLLGMFNFASLPVDHTPLAHVWMGGPNLISQDLGRPMSENYSTCLASQPQIDRCEIFLEGLVRWTRPDGGSRPVMLIASRVHADALGAMEDLTPEMRDQLSYPGTVVVDESALGHLGIQGVGDIAHITDKRVRVVGVLRGYRDMAGSFIFCSIETARSLLPLGPDQTIFVLGHCHNPADAPSVVKNLRATFPEFSFYTREELSLRSRMYWLTRTKAGLALGYAAALGLLVGAVVTSQTLYAGTAASLREYAVLWAMGIPVSRMAAMVLTQSLWVGIAGVILALPMMFVLAHIADWLDLSVELPVWLISLAIVVTLLTALLSGLLAMRLIWRMEPTSLLR